jgi:GNAT-like C-terminal domain/N-acyltransferase N-terminal domain
VETASRRAGDFLTTRLGRVAQPLGRRARRYVRGVTSLPDDAAAHDLLRRVGVAAAVIPEILAARPERGTEGWAQLAAWHHELLTESSPALWPPSAPDAPATQRWLQLWAIIAAVPRVLALNAARGIEDDITWHTLADIGINIDRHSSAHGRPGFDGAFWLCQHVRGQIYRLGRLQFNVVSITFDPGPDAPFRVGDPALGVHIPPGSPLDPAACDDSLGRAGSFFAQHLPGTTYDVATCASWLLDEQLVDMVGPSSNIVRFQRRFTPVAGWSAAGDEDVLRFVFGNPDADLDALTPRTTLERAIVGHLRAGRHFHNRLGWLRLST